MFYSKTAFFPKVFLEEEDRMSNIHKLRAVIPKVGGSEAL